MTNVIKPNISLGLLILRVAVGTIFIAHGAQKAFERTLPGTAQAFAKIGAPFPEVTGPTVALLELIGGLLLLVGLLTRLVAAFLAVTMFGALVLVHLPAGFWVSEGGYEYVVMLGAAALTLAFTGADRYSLDHLVLRRPSRKTLSQ